MPPSPELNPVEKIWQWMKDKTAMKFFEDIGGLQDKITQMVNQLELNSIK